MYPIKHEYRVGYFPSLQNGRYLSNIQISDKVERSYTKSIERKKALERIENYKDRMKIKNVEKSKST